jgi:hypothetical protein
MAELKKVNRIDSVDPGKWMTTPFKKGDEGFLTGRAIVTSVGVFSYLNADGTVTRELRLPEEVFARGSLDSMKLKPLANDHPKEKITADNAKVYQVGSLGDNPSDWIDNYGSKFPEERGRGSSDTDGFHVAIDLTITDAAAVADVEAGKTALSMGYTCDLEPATAGAVWCGIAYDGIQRNIRYNHCAIVDVARCGDAARIRMDSADAVQIYQADNKSPKTNPEVVKMGMKKINLDGVEYEGEEKLVLSYVEQKNRADSAEKALTQLKADQAKTISTLEGERDAMKDRADKAEKELKAAKDDAADSKKINEAVNAKLMLIDAATRAGVQVKEDMADIDIRKAVITAIYPNVKLDGKDEVYVTARFDAAVEDLDARADGESREVLGGGLSATADRKDSASARQKMIDRMQASSRGESKKEG